MIDYMETYPYTDDACHILSRVGVNGSIAIIEPLEEGIAPRWLAVEVVAEQMTNVQEGCSVRPRHPLEMLGYTNLDGSVKRNPFKILRFSSTTAGKGSASGEGSGGTVVKTGTTENQKNEL